MAMLLIDAANVSGGGAVLLQYLTQKLQEKDLPFFVLKKEENKLPIHSDQYADVQITLVNRKDLLIHYIRQLKPTTILCFGNFPPPFYTGIHTITYFHNPHYVDGHDQANFSLRHRLTKSLRRAYLQTNLNKSNLFIVQTPYIARALQKTYNLPDSRIRILPFYNLECITSIRTACQFEGLIKQANSFLYASSPEPHKNHFKLLDAWEGLHHQHITPTLYLTISPSSPYTTPALLNRIDMLKQKGLAIENLGAISYHNLLRRTYTCSACIFPSANETLGLGLVEAHLMGNAVLASRKPYLPDVIKPSIDFDPHNPDNIADAVKRYYTGLFPASTLVIKNQIDAFITLLYEQQSVDEQTTKPNAKQAIDYHSTIAEAFNDKYAVSPGFQERFRIWTSLFNQYISPGSRVLDLGCGSGVFSVYLGGQGCTVTGIDGSKQMIALCEQNRQSVNETYVIQTLPLDNTATYAPCDVVIASSLLEYLDDMPLMLRQAHLILKPTGLLIVSIPNRRSIWRRIERLAYAFTRRPTYFGHIRNVSDVPTFNRQLELLGFEVVDTRFFSSFDPVSRLLKAVLPPSFVNNLFVSVYRKQ